MSGANRGIEWVGPTGGWRLTESGVGGLLPWGSGPWSGWGSQGVGGAMEWVWLTRSQEWVGSGAWKWVANMGDGVGGNQEWVGFRALEWGIGAHTESCLMQATVGAIVSGGAADVDGHLLIRDEINHHSVMDASHRDVMSLTGAMGEVMLGTRRKMPLPETLSPTSGVTGGSVVGAEGVWDLSTSTILEVLWPWKGKTTVPRYLRGSVMWSSTGPTHRPALGLCCSPTPCVLGA